MSEDIGRAVRETIGTASVCWNPMDCTGEFDEKHANRIADELIVVIDQYAAAAVDAALKSSVCPHGDLAAERDDYARRLRATDQSWAAMASERDSLTGRAAELVGETNQLRERLAEAEENIIDYRDALSAMQAERDRYRAEVAEHLRTIRNIGECREQDASGSPDGGGGRDAGA